MKNVCKDCAKSRTRKMGTLPRFRSVSFFGIFLSLAVLFIAPAWAQNPLAAAGQFNVFTEGNAKLVTNESEGPVAIGGNLTVAGNYQVAFTNVGNLQVSGVPIGLVVAGGVTLEAGQLQINNSGYAKIGNCADLKVWYKDNNNAFSPIRVTKSTDSYPSPSAWIQINTSANNFLGGPVSETNNPVCESSPVNFSSAFSLLKASSSKLTQCVSSVITQNANGETIGSISGQNLYLGDGAAAGKPRTWNVSGDDLNSINELNLRFTPTANQPLVINVSTGASFTWNVKNQNVSGTMKYIIWNFPNASTLNIEGNATIEGSVLAPNADVTKTVNQSNLEGQLIAKSYFQSGGEMHHYPFDGSPDCGNTPPVCNAPTPQGNGAAVCSGSTANLTATGCDAVSGFIAKWFSDAALTTEIPSSNGVFTTPALAQTTDYYVACVKNTDATCKSGGVKVTATVKPDPTLSVSGGSPACSQDGKTYSITVSSNGTISANAGTVSGLTVSGIAVGTNVEITATLDGCTKKINVNSPNCTEPCVKPDAGNDVTTCETTKQLAAPNGATWSFLSSSNSTTPSISAGGLVSGLTSNGTYKFVLTKTATCSDTVTITKSSLNIGKLPDQDLCPGQILTFGYGGLSDVTYLWSTGATTPTIVVNPIATTDYIVTVTSTISNCSVNDTVKVVVNPKPNAGENQIICIPTTKVNAADASKGESWAFFSFNSPNAATTATTETIDQQGNIAGLNVNGFYRFILKNGNGCTDTVRIQRTSVTLPEISLNPICPGTTLTFGYNNTTDFTYSWSTGATTGQISVKPDITTDYIVEATAVATGCKVKDTVTVTVKPKPTLTLSSVVCAPDLKTYTTTVTVENGTVVTANVGTVSGSGTTFTVQVGSDTTGYTITATLNGCKNNLDITKPNCSCPPIDPPTAPNASVCSGTTATITASACTTGNTAKWFSNANLTTEIPSNNGVYTTPALTQTTDYYVACVSNATPTCKSNGVKVTVTIKPKPTVSVSSTTCNQAGTFYDVAFTATTGATITANKGTVGNGVITGIAAGETVKIVVELDGCKDSTTATKNCTVTCQPPTPSSPSKEICKSTSTTLVATGCSTEYPTKWFSDAALTTEIPSSNGIYTTPVLTQNADYYVACVKDVNCKSNGVKVTVTVKPLPKFSNVNTTCAANNSTYSTTISSTGTVTVKSPSGASISGSSPYTISGITAGQNLVLTSTLDGCPKDTTIMAPSCGCAPQTPMAVAANVGICEGDPIPNPTFTALVGANTTVDWYAAATGGSPITTNSLTFTATAAGTFYLQAKTTLEGCNGEVNPVRVPVTLAINPKPVFALEAKDPTCQASTSQNDGSVKIKTGTVGNRYKFNTTGFANLATTATGADTIKAIPATVAQNIPNNAPQTTYYVRVFSNEGCYEDASVTVNPKICDVACPTLATADAADSLCSGYIDAAEPFIVNTTAADSIRFVRFDVPQTNPYTAAGGVVQATIKPNAGVAAWPEFFSPTFPTNSGTAPVKYYVYALLKTPPTSANCRPFVEKIYTVLPLPQFTLTSTDACTGDTTYKVNLTISSVGNFTVTVGTGGISTIGNGVSVNTVTQTLNNVPGGGQVTILTLKTTSDYFVVVEDSKGCNTAAPAPKPTFKPCGDKIYDLALDKSISKKKSFVGDTLTYTIKITNQDTTTATGVTVKDLLNAGVEYVSSVASKGSYDPATKIWTVGTVKGNEVISLQIKVKVKAQGVWFNTAEINTMNEKDKDSTPGNGIDGEDDIDRECFSVPIDLCAGQGVQAVIPSFYQGVKWFKNGGSTVVFEGNDYTIREAGIYTFTATNGTCPAEGCCPIEVKVIDCCPADLCIPFTIKQTKKAGKPVR